MGERLRQETKVEETKRRHLEGHADHARSAEQRQHYSALEAEDQ